MRCFGGERNAARARTESLPRLRRFDALDDSQALERLTSRTRGIPPDEQGGAKSRLRVNARPVMTCRRTRPTRVEANSTRCAIAPRRKKSFERTHMTRIVLRSERTFVCPVRAFGWRSCRTCAFVEWNCGSDVEERSGWRGLAVEVRCWCGTSMRTGRPNVRLIRDRLARLSSTFGALAGTESGAASFSLRNSGPRAGVRRT